MERENDLTSLVQLLLDQQKTIRQLYNELKIGKASPAHSQRKNIPYHNRCLNATERCTYNWVAASEFDIPDNAKVYTDEEIEDLEIFRKSHYSECHNKGPSFLVTSNSSPPPKLSHDNYLSTFDHHDDIKELYCVENYSLNNRMFPILSSEPTGNQEETTKRVLQISIPSTSLKTDYKFKPRNRKSFDSVNTMGLSKHCIKGLNTAKYPVMPVQQLLSIHSSVERANNS